MTRRTMLSLGFRCNRSVGGNSKDGLVNALVVDALATVVDEHLSYFFHAPTS